LILTFDSERQKLVSALSPPSQLSHGQWVAGGTPSAWIAPLIVTSSGFVPRPATVS
jgi:hypothetical protein